MVRKVNFYFLQRNNSFLFIYRKDCEKWWNRSVCRRTHTNHRLQCTGRAEIAGSAEDSHNRCHWLIDNGYRFWASQRMQIYRTNHIESMQTHGKRSTGTVVIRQRHLAWTTGDRVRQRRRLGTAVIEEFDAIAKINNLWVFIPERLGWGLQWTEAESTEVSNNYQQKWMRNESVKTRTLSALPQS